MVAAASRMQRIHLPDAHAAIRATGARLCGGTGLDKAYDPWFFRISSSLAAGRPGAASPRER